MQINIDAGRLPPAHANGRRYLTIPIRSTEPAIIDVEPSYVASHPPDIALIDVREPAEWDIVHLDGAQLIPQSLIDSGEGLAQLPQDRMAVLYCKTGVRSAAALAAVRKAGFADAVHLRGGIVAWAKQMQPDMVMY